MRKGSKHTAESIALIKKNNVMGKLHYTQTPAWKGDGASYFAIHIWLKNHYGKAIRCEMDYCSGKSQTYQWALIKGKKYEHNVDNYMQLCRSCHAKYDYTEKQREFRREYLRVHHIASKNYANKQQIA